MYVRYVHATNYIRVIGATDRGLSSPNKSPEHSLYASTVITN